MINQTLKKKIDYSILLLTIFFQKPFNILQNRDVKELFEGKKANVAYYNYLLNTLMIFNFILVCVQKKNVCVSAEFFYIQKTKWKYLEWI